MGMRQLKQKEPKGACRSATGLLLLVSLYGLLPVSAQEGNYKFENFGNQSVLLNGNVTGSVADLGLVYYNPARLGLIDNPSFTIGGKAYEWSKYYFDEVLESDKSLSSNQFDGIPATIAGTFNIKFLPGHKFAYSILSRHRSNIRVNYDSGLVPVDGTPRIPDATQTFTELDFRDRLRDDWFGITWAYAFSDSFSVGISLFGSNYEHNGSGDVLINVEREGGQVVGYTNRLDYTQKTYGGQFKIGSAWLLDDIEMGASLTLPFIPVKKRASFKYQLSLNGFSPEQDILVALDYGDLESSRKTATAISYGVGIPWKNHKIHLNLDWYAPVGAYDRIEVPEEALVNLEENPFIEESKGILNFGVGGQFHVSPSLNVIGSFSSDFSASVESINLFGANLPRPWGTIILGTSYARTGSKIGTAPEIPEDGTQVLAQNISTQINYERWRFIVGLEIPLLLEKVKDLPIPIK